MFKFITHRPLWLNLLIGLLLALIVFFIFVFSLNWLTHHNEAKTVPSVLGKSFSEAESLLAQAGFEVEIQDSIYVDTVPPMRVLKQVPEDGEVVKINRTVYLTINRAVPPLVEMPNLVGFSFRSAEMEIVNMGLRIGDTTYEPNFAKAVLRQLYKGSIITPGTKIRMGSAISFVLGSGIGTEKFIVPSLFGMRFGDARTLIESHGLVIGSIMAIGVSDTSGAFIYKQNPERYDDEKKFRYIKTGQTIDVWLQIDKPVTDTLSVPLQEQ